MPSNESDELSFDLVENAEDSLAHGVDHFLEARKSGVPKHLKYTILHTFHATELYLKARLQKAHPSLIFSKPEEARKEDAKTVDFDTLLARLTSAGVVLSGEEQKDLNHLRRIRNRIEHHKVTFEIEEAKDYIGRAMRFLEKFLWAELKVGLGRRLEAETYRALSEAVHDYEHRLHAALAEASREVPADKDGIGYEWVLCPHCDEQVIPIAPGGGGGEVHCHFCGKDSYVEGCTGCGHPIVYLGRPDEGSWSALCRDCENYRMSRD